MKTFKEIQDDVLELMGDTGDAGVMRELVKDTIQVAHRTVLTKQMYDFMLWPRQETLEIASGAKNAPLHPLYMQGLWFYESEGNRWLEEVSPKGQLELGESPVTAVGNDKEFMLTGLQPVRVQPNGSTVKVVTSSSTEPAANTFTITGIDSDGEYAEETLSSGSPWSTISGTVDWDVITSVTKNGTPYTQTYVELRTAADVVLLKLRASERGKQYRNFEFISTPTTARTVTYRFYQKPKDLSADYDIPQIPEEFSDILYYRSLLALHGHNRATSAEQERWQAELDKLEFNMISTYTQTRTLGGRPQFVNYRER